MNASNDSNHIYERALSCKYQEEVFLLIQLVLLMNWAAIKTLIIVSSSVM